MRKIYEALGLPEFATIEPTLRAYVDSLSGYRKNMFPELAPNIRRRIAGGWRRCFERRFPQTLIRPQV
jgi:ribosome modulation factor